MNELEDRAAAPAAELGQRVAANPEEGQSAALRKPVWTLFGSAFLLWLASAWPVVFGLQTYYLRDVFLTHYWLKAAQVAAWSAGRIPLIDLNRGGGQASLGNPNGLPLYPDNLLYLLGDTLWALNAHFWVHWLLSAVSLYALCRAWRFSREAAAIGGVIYATSGYLFSQLNLYNSIVAAAVAPGFVAAVLGATGKEGEGRQRFLGTAVAGLWALLLLGGEPFLAAATLAMAGLAVLLRRHWDTRGIARTLAALALGTLLALPQLVEAARNFPASRRALQTVDAAEVGRKSFDPRWAADWIVPLMLGEPARAGSLWSQRLSTGESLYYTLFPGVAGLILPFLGLRAWRRRRVLWGAMLVAGGLFLVAGRFNPLFAWALDMEALSTFRYPIRFWLLVAVGWSVLAAAGYEQLAADPRGRRRLLRWALALAAVYVVIWTALRVFAGPIDEGLARLLDRPDGLSLAVAERQRWMLRVVATGACALALAGVAWIGRYRAGLAAMLLTGLIVVSQQFLLRGAAPTDATVVYRLPSPVLAVLPPHARVAHEAELFRPRRPPFGFPTRDQYWYVRQALLAGESAFADPKATRYDLATSAEHLSTLRLALARAGTRQLPLGERMRLLRGLGLTHYVREMRGADEPVELASILLSQTQFGVPVDVVAIRDPLPEFSATANTRFAARPSLEMRTLIAEDFDPLGEIVLPGAGAPTQGGVGAVSVLRQEAEHVAAEVSLPAAGYFLVQRAHLPIYRATVDGREAAIAVANLYRLAVPVPAGTHRVELWIDRRPTNLAFGFAGGALLALAALAIGWRW